MIAGAGLWFTGPRGHTMRRNWSRGDTIGFFVLLAGALFLFNRVVLQHVHEWQVTTQYDKNRMIDLGLDGALSLAVGLGILPVIGGLVSLRLPERRGDRTYRAYVAWTATIIAALAVYTADKAAYNSTLFGTYWEERPLIFLSPLLLLGTAMALQAKRLDRWFLAGATALVGVMVLFKTVQLGWPYYEAPGSAIPGALSYYKGWTQHDVRISLIVILVLSVGLLLARRWRALVVLTVAIGFVWMLAGEITMTVGIDRAAHQFRANLPADLSWVDHAVHGGSVTFLGQGTDDLDGENLTEFWNRSVKHVDSLDGLAPGPGPTGTPTAALAGRAALGAQPHAVRPRRQRGRARRARARASREHRPRPLRAHGPVAPRSTPCSSSTPTAGARTGAATPTSSHTSAERSLLRSAVRDTTARRPPRRCRSTSGRCGSARTRRCNSQT